jgi:hypothetical protein
MDANSAARRTNADETSDGLALVALIFAWPGLGANEKLLYIHLASQRQGDSLPAIVDQSPAAIAAALGETERTVQRWIKGLIEAGLVERVEAADRRLPYYVVQDLRHLAATPVVGRRDPQRKLDFEAAAPPQLSLYADAHSILDANTPQNTMSNLVPNLTPGVTVLAPKVSGGVSNFVPKLTPTHPIPHACEDLARARALPTTELPLPEALPAAAEVGARVAAQAEDRDVRREGMAIVRMLGRSATDARDCRLVYAMAVLMLDPCHRDWVERLVEDTRCARPAKPFAKLTAASSRFAPDGFDLRTYVGRLHAPPWVLDGWRIEQTRSASGQAAAARPTPPPMSRETWLAVQRQTGLIVSPEAREPVDRDLRAAELRRQAEAISRPEACPNGRYRARE